MSEDFKKEPKKIKAPRKGSKKRALYDEKFGLVMSEFYKGRLWSCGRPVRNISQAKAIALSTARKHADRYGKPVKKSSKRTLKRQKTCSVKKEKYKEVQKKRVARQKSKRKTI